MGLQRLIPARNVRKMNEPDVVVLPRVRQLVAHARELLPLVEIDEVFGKQERLGFTTTGAAVPRELRTRQFCNANPNVGNRARALHGAGRSSSSPL